MIGEGCVIGEGAVLGTQVRLSSGRVIENGQTVTDGQPVFSSCGADLLAEGGIMIASSACDASLMFRIGDAVAAATSVSAAAAPAPGKPVGIMRTGDSSALRRLSGLIAMGAAGRGSDVYDFGEGFRAMASFAAQRYATPLTLCLEERTDGVFISLFDDTGLCPPRTVERAIIAALATAPQSMASQSMAHSGEPNGYNTRIANISGVAELYRAALARLFESGQKPLKELKVTVSAPDSALNTASSLQTPTQPASILTDVLRSAGAEIESGSRPGQITPLAADHDKSISVSMSSDGMSLSVIERTKTHSCELDPWHIMALIFVSELEKSQTTRTPIALPHSAPRILESLATQRGITPLRYASQPSDDSERTARIVAGEQRYQFDAAFAAVKLCIIAMGGNLKAVSNKIPHFFLASGDFDTDFAYKTLVMRRFGIPAGDGVCLESNSSGSAVGTVPVMGATTVGAATAVETTAAAGATDLDLGVTTCESPSRVRVIPKRHGGFRIIAEADTMEAAEEMLSLSKKRIGEIIADAQTR